MVCENQPCQHTKNCNIFSKTLSYYNSHLDYGNRMKFTPHFAEFHVKSYKTYRRNLNRRYC